MFKAFPPILALLLCASVCAPAMAQTAPVQANLQPDKSASSLNISGFALDFLDDQKAIWTSPLHVSGGDLKWLAPAAAGTGILFVFDHRISDAIKPDTSLRGPSNTISNIGNITPFAVPGTMWFLGAVKHDDHAAETGRLGLEAEANAEVVMTVLKLATQRTRPNLSNNMSFPSGHTMSAFALASVLSSEYHNKPLVVFGSYGFATAVGFARVGGLNHFPSDVVAGAVIGELIGRYVVHHHAKLAEQN
jgi:membrane-associated phospholipid phosphatase